MDSDTTVVGRGMAAEALREHFFNVLDGNNDGKVDRSELGSVLQRVDRAKWTDVRLDELMSAMDTNEDGTISLEEFLQWIFHEGEEQQALNEELDQILVSVISELPEFLITSRYAMLPKPMKEGFLSSFHKTSYGQRLIAYVERCAHHDREGLAPKLVTAISTDANLKDMLQMLVTKGKATSSPWYKFSLQFTSLVELKDALK